MKFATPAASDDVTQQADWLEAMALSSTERRVSLEELVAQIRRGGTVDALGEEDASDDSGGEGFEELPEEREDKGSETSQRIAGDAFGELNNRALACNGRYPFEVTQGLLTVKDKPERAVYTLLFLLSQTAPTSGHKGTAALFERVCTGAAEQYLGAGARAFRFGAPRKKPLSKLCEALDHLCTEVGEGGGCHQAADAANTGDGGLDIVAWKHFPDRKAGKLIAFGQCAGGSTAWDDKLTELDGTKFAKKFLRDPFAADPIRLFFVPRFIEVSDWRSVGIDGGILFDRARITAFASDTDSVLSKDCEEVTKRLLEKFVKEQRSP